MKAAQLLRFKYVYLLLAPGAILIFLFSYVPIYGLLLAFKDLDFSKGIMRSPWVGLDFFKAFWDRDDFWQAFRNTLTISGARIVFGFSVPIILSLLLNELRVAWFKKVVQTTMYFPFFLSWVVLYAMIVNVFSLNRGVVNDVLGGFGLEKVQFLTNELSWFIIVIGSDIWKNAGYGMIIYLAAMTKIDPDLYDAADIDGAGRFRKMAHITIPGIQMIILVIFILTAANILNAGFDQIYNLSNPAVQSIADIIDTYVIREGLSKGNISLATAVGLSKSVIALCILIVVNWLSTRIRGVGLYT